MTMSKLHVNLYCAARQMYLCQTVCSVLGSASSDLFVRGTTELTERTFLSQV